ncbi:MAG TPA: RsmD family RNA methyltransferase, partial [Acidimicrobiales bacterium]|nr:RsmD family RNA methyltransferase [Acidimicrobiales bacterium]
GLEALSRGAAAAVFVDRDRAAGRAIQTNIETLGFSDRAVLRLRPVAAELGAGPEGPPFDLALLDPPYDFEGWEDLFAALPASLAVAESSHPVSAEGWEVLRAKRYGRTHVTILERP